MILVFQKYHFNFTAGDAKLCWISIFTFSSRFLFILFLCFWGTLASAFYAPCPWLGQFLFVKKQKWASCSLAPTAVPCATWLPFLCYSFLYLLLTPLLSVLLSLLVICTKYSRPGSKCGCTSRPSTSCYSPKSSSSSPGSIPNSMCAFSAKSNEIFAACD